MSPQSMFRRAGVALVAAAAIFGMVLNASADKLHLKDGRVLDGKIVRQGEGFVFFKHKVGSVDTEELFTTDQVAKIEKTDAAADAAASDESAKKDDPKSGEAKKDDASKPADDHKKSGATKMVLLNFGPPREWQGRYESMVGIHVNFEAFKNAAEQLKKKDVDVVVIRVNSGGGMSYEMPRFQDLFENVYKKNWRTVAWIDQAISAAAMSPWPIEEYYFFPEGKMGACTEFTMNDMKASSGGKLELILARMEMASGWGKKNPAIMRAMQIQEPLSADIDQQGNVIWRQDEDGQYLLNPKGQVFTINSNQAIKFKFAQGIASTKEELVSAMKIHEAEWVAQDVTDYVANNIKENHVADKRFEEIITKYEQAVSLAASLPDRERRSTQISIARRHLAEIQHAYKVNPNYGLIRGIDDDWFRGQERRLKELAGP